MQKSLDRKLAAIHADPLGSREFILADAKDADMAFGIGAPGKSPEAHAGEVRFRTLGEYREQIRQIVRQGLVDIMLMSASTNDVLTIRERLFDGSHVTPAARANDTTDIFVVRGNAYIQEPSRPFRTTTLDHIQCGHLDCRPDERVLGANLGLYSTTFNNRLDDDLASLEEYRQFRIEAEQKGFKHFWEVFDPNAPQGLADDEVGPFVNDCIARALAGVPQAGRPLFLKMVYHGPKAMEELVAYDPHLIVGILGGGAGTTYDAFKLISEAQKYGARVALFGRKINGAECQLAFVEFLRRIVDGEVTAEEAVRAYHAVLQKLGIKPFRSLEDDLTLQTNVMSYSGGSTVTVPAGVPVGGPSRGLRVPGAEPERCPSAVHSGASLRSAPGTHSDGEDPEQASKYAGCGCKANEKTASTSPAGLTTCSCHETSAPPPSSGPSQTDNGKPDFARMTPAQKLAWNKAERNRIFGR